MTTSFDIGLSVANGANYNMQRLIVEADDIHEAIRLAEAEAPGFLVHHAFVIEGDQLNRKNTQNLEWWMATHMPGVLRTQNPGSEIEGN